MKRELKSSVVLLIAALACGCASERGGMLRYEVSLHHNSSIYATKTGNCNGIGCCPSQASCNDRGQVPESAAPEIRIDLEVRGHAMPEEFRLSESLIGEKTISKPVSIADPICESSKIGTSGRQTTFLDFAGLFLNSITPLATVTRVFSVGSAIVDGINSDISVPRAQRSERKAAYSQLTDLVIAGAEKEFELQELPSLSRENAEGIEGMQRNVIEYTVWIKPLRIRVKEKPENVMDKDAKLLNDVEVVTDVETRTKTGLLKQVVFHIE